MSTYEWEAGTIKIPTSEWTKTKTAIREAMNRRQTALLAISEKVYEQLVVKLPEFKKQIKAGTLDEWRIDTKLYDIVSAQVQAYESRFGRGKQCVDNDDHREILNKIYVEYDPKTHKKITPKLRKPQKKDYPLAGNNVLHFSADDCSVVLDNDAKTVRWTVHENNHACDHAKATVLGQTFYELMDKITWVRGTGGTIVGNNEYNRDSDSVGGGGNYVVATFSAEEQKRKREAEAAARRSYSGGYGYGVYRGGYR